MKEKEINDEIKAVANCKENADCEELNINGDIYKTTYTKKYRNREKWQKPNPKMVYSFIPGTIIEILVKVGDKVSEGDKLYRLDAMKMNNNVYAEYSGTIAKIHVKKGDAIPKNELVLEFE